MKTKRAIEILKSLVEGVHPTTGGELPADTVFQSAEVLHALLVGITVLEEQRARESRRSYLPANVGNRWTAEELQVLLDAFHNGEPMGEIASRLGRTLRAIEARLFRLGLITPQQRQTSDTFT